MLNCIRGKYEVWMTGQNGKGNINERLKDKVLEKLKRDWVALGVERGFKLIYEKTFKNHKVIIVRERGEIIMFIMKMHFLSGKYLATMLNDSNLLYIEEFLCILCTLNFNNDANDDYWTSFSLVVAWRHWSRDFQSYFEIRLSAAFFVIQLNHSLIRASM